MMGQMGFGSRIAVAAALCLSLAACDSASTGKPAVEAPRLAANAPEEMQVAATRRTQAGQLPAMHWDGTDRSREWTRATLAALDTEGAALMSRVPSDVMEFCPSYAAQTTENRRAFWAGLLSALARYESSHNPAAKGAGGRYLGLMQISPATARNYGCSGSMLNGSENMACAVRIVARQVGRDNAVARSGQGWGGVARDWMPMRSASKRNLIAGWTSRQSYCR
ncbi:transglycosylase SLT domain-containing protein [Paracoccus aerodenitrificans]|uniref:transglycosylase SLT domain-containing protein n=1 Tax=Paracoccus aerodenitrificans TaxID=3017781 RepID=UPI0022F008CC|nr:transglycosylase SLT domain-containing protein [Paracoccus aerodenitrificans]WBU62870.1 transglycosylase SLT domain-containing protein [Paracoccus aerodenitrificans]